MEADRMLTHDFSYTFFKHKVLLTRKKDNAIILLSLEM